MQPLRHWVSRNIFFNYWTLDVGRTASYEITLVLLSVVCLSVSLSVCLSGLPSVSFLKIASLVFSGIVHDYNWPWHLVTDEARFLKKKKKKNGGPNLDPTVLSHAQNEVLDHFLEFGSLVFLEIAYNDSFQQCLISGRSKTHEISFSPFSRVWFISFPMNCIGW